MTATKQDTNYINFQLKIVADIRSWQSNALKTGNF